MIFNPFVPGQPAQDAPGPLTLATVGTVTEDGATLILPGATAPTQARYPYLGSASIAAGDAVIIARVSGAWVILGKFSGGSEPGPSGDGLPAGGVPGQMLLKTGTADYAAGWQYPQYCRPNLLDNWYFVGGGSQSGDGVFPINQRGETIKTGVGHFFDRWRITGYSPTRSELTANGVTVTGNSTSGVSSIRQDILKSPAVGSQLTVSMLCTTGDSETNIYFRFYHADGTYDQISTSAMSVDGRLRWGTVTLTADAKYASFRISKYTGTATFEAVKVEYGEYQTLAHKDGNGNWVLNALPNWFEELRKCQRYLQWVPSPYSGNFAPVGSGICWGTTTARIALPLPVPMVGTPTVTFQNSNARIYLSDGSEAITPTTINAQTSGYNNANMRSILCLVCAIEGGINRAQVVLAISGTGNPGGILLSCED